LTINHRKAAEAGEILGTKTLVDTVDAALDEVIRLAARRRCSIESGEARRVASGRLPKNCATFDGAR